MRSYLWTVVSGERSMSWIGPFSYVPRVHHQCPCGRDLAELDSDRACDAALRRARVVAAAALDTSRAIDTRRNREQQETRMR